MMALWEKPQINFRDTPPYRSINTPVIIPSQQEKELKELIQNIPPLDFSKQRPGETVEAFVARHKKEVEEALNKKSQGKSVYDKVDSK